MTKGALVFEGNEKLIYATDEPDKVIFRYKDVTVAYNNVKRARFKGKGALNNQISAMLMGYLNSHGEGKFMVSEELAKELFANGQVAFQYVDPFSEEVTMEAPYNPNGSNYAIEGIISPNGQILGKMGHTERWEPNLFKNIEEELYQPLFDNAVSYFKKNR